MTSAYGNCGVQVTSQNNFVPFPQLTTSLKPFGEIIFHFEIIPSHSSFPTVTEKPSLMERLLGEMKSSREVMDINKGFLTSVILCVRQFGGFLHTIFLLFY